MQLIRSVLDSWSLRIYWPLPLSAGSCCVYCLYTVSEIRKQTPSHVHAPPAIYTSLISRTQHQHPFSATNNTIVIINIFPVFSKGGFWIPPKECQGAIPAIFNNASQPQRRDLRDVATKTAKGLYIVDCRLHRCVATFTTIVRYPTSRLRISRVLFSIFLRYQTNTHSYCRKLQVTKICAAHTLEVHTYTHTSKHSENVAQYTIQQAQSSTWTWSHSGPRKLLA